MNTLLTLIDEPVSPDLSLEKMEHAITTVVEKIAAGEEGLSAAGTAPTITLAATVQLASTGSSAEEAALPVTHDWGTRSYVQIAVLMFATTVGLYLCYLLAAPFLSPIAWSLALAVVCVPMQRRIEAVVRSPGVAAAISVVLIGSVVLVLVTFVGERLGREASSGAQLVNARIESGEWRRAIEMHPRLIPLADWLEQQNLPETVKSTATWMSTTGSGFVRGSIIEVMSLLLTFYLLFYFLRDRLAAIAMLRSMLPLTHVEMDRLLNRVTDTIHATIYGTMIVAAVQGFLGGLMFWWLGLPAPLLWGVVMGLLAIIPLLGAFIVWVPAALFLLIDGHWGQAMVLSLWGLIVVGTIDNFLRPILVGQRLQLPTVLAFISVVGGIAVFGPAGLILGPVTLSITMVLLEIWPRPTVLAVSRSADLEAISRFENEGGAPASKFFTNQTTAVA